MSEFFLDPVDSTSVHVLSLLDNSDYLSTRQNTTKIMGLNRKFIKKNDIILQKRYGGLDIMYIKV